MPDSLVWWFADAALLLMIPLIGLWSSRSAHLRQHAAMVSNKSAIGARNSVSPSGEW